MCEDLLHLHFKAINKSNQSNLEIYKLKLKIQECAKDFCLT